MRIASSKRARSDLLERPKRFWYQSCADAVDDLCRSYRADRNFLSRDTIKMLLLVEHLLHGSKFQTLAPGLKDPGARKRSRETAQ
jgi:hypothetical protein